jgi:hypothetical protein
MRDPANPIRDEIKAWAFNEGAIEPMQDWDLMLASQREYDLYGELAADDACPNRDYFLRLLYLIVGDAVRTNYRTESLDSVRQLLKHTTTHPKYRFHLLRSRAEKLIREPETFSYDDWCGGALVTQDIEADAGLKNPILD